MLDIKRRHFKKLIVIGDQEGNWNFKYKFRQEWITTSPSATLKDICRSQGSVQPKVMALDQASPIGDYVKSKTIYIGSCVIEK